MAGQGLPKIIPVSVAAALVALSYGTIAKATRPDKIVAQMFPTFTIWPGTPYDNEYNDPDATGTAKAIQPNRNIDVTIAVSTNGLIPNTQYLVKFDTNGNGANWDSLGPWTPSMGDFITDATGRGTWSYTARAGTYAPGTYTWSVFINLATVYPPRSILVSENIVFTIPSR